MKNLHIEEIPNVREGVWNAFVESNDGRVFNSYQWTRMLEESFGHRPARFVLRGEKNEIVAALAGVITSRGRFVAVPAAGYCDVVARDDEARRVFLVLLVTEMGKRDCAIALNLTRGETAPGLEHGHTANHFILDTSRPFEEIWTSSIKRKTRNLVRKSGKSGVIVECNHSISKEYLNIYYTTMQRLGYPPLTHSFYEAMERNLGGILTFYGASHEGELVAGLVTLTFNKVLHIWGNASLTEARDLAPNDALYSAAIEDACSGSIDRVDFGSSAVDSGHEKFKLGFGGIPQPIYSASGAPSSDGKAYYSPGLVNALCHRTPIVLQDTLGSIVYRYLY